jgi:HEAT repeat protein
MLKGTEDARRLAGIELISRRHMTEYVPQLLEAARQTDTAVRPAALKKVGELGGTSETDPVLELLGKLTAPDDLDAAEQALSSLCARADRPATAVKKLTSRLAQMEPGQKGVLLRVLSTIGGPEALQTVRGAVKESNPEVHAAAIRALGSWKTADAAPDLLALAKNASNATDKTLSLRSYLGMAANTDVSAEQRLFMCGEASKLQLQAEEKRLLLSALGSINSPAALALATPHLADPVTKEEAIAAITSVAERILRDQNTRQLAPELVEPLEKAVQAAANEESAKRAKELLQRAQKRAGNR